MDAVLDSYLAQTDSEPGDDDEHYGWYKAEMAEAWTVSDGIGILEDGAVRIANSDEARGVRRHWREMDITR